MTAALVAGLLAGYGIAVPVGAVAAYLVTLTARTSLRVGLGAALGVATADGLYALLAVLTGTALAGPIESVAGPLRWLSAAVLLAVGIRLAVRAVRSFRTRSLPTHGGSLTLHPARAYVDLVGLTLLNPATIVYFTALLVGTQAGAAVSPVERLVFVFSVFVASASWQILLVIGGSLLGRTLTGPRGRLVTALVSGGLIAVMALRIGLGQSGHPG